MKSTQHTSNDAIEKQQSKENTPIKNKSDRLKLKRVKEKIESAYHPDNNLFI